MDTMCLNSEEKKELLGRVGQIEAGMERQNLAMKVVISVSAVFVGLLLSIATWYLNDREEDYSAMNESLMSMSVDMTELRVTMEFFVSSFSSHISDPENHPNNTERVDRILLDLRDLRQEMRKSPMRPE